MVETDPAVGAGQRKGEAMTKSLPRGIRNHNPGNLRLSKDPWQGLADKQTDGAFFQFREAKWGIRALARTLITYQDRHGLKTVRELIGRWAPPSENNTPAYVAAVAKALGVGQDDPVDLQDHAVMEPLVKAIIRHENGQQPYTQAQIDAGLVLAGIEPPGKPITKTRTVQASQVAAGATVTGLAAEIVREAEPAIPLLRIVADAAPWVLGVVILAAIGWIVWARIDDRKKGLR